MPESSQDTSEYVLKHVIIYTDGGAVPNPGRGGYGVVLRFGEYCKELSAGYRLTTNNRMELMAVIVALEALKVICRVTLHSDSKYIIDAITTGSAFKWRANDWAMNVTKTKLAKNSDLWERLLSAYERHEVELIWVKGHAGIPDNERCDTLADAALNQSNLLEDTAYESDPSTTGSTDLSGRTTPMGKKVKMTVEGQPCWKCETPVEKRVPKKKPAKSNQSYCYDWYLYCPGCRSMYMVEAAKREL